MTAKSRLTPTRLRLILIGCMVALVAIGVGVFMFGRGIISDYAHESQRTAAEAQSSSKTLDQLKRTKETLSRESATIERTSQLVAESKHYVYQDKIIEDITKYANDAGLSITNITFSDVKATTTTSTPAAGSAAAATPATPAPANIKSRIATVTLSTPVDYYKWLTFIHSIEQGLFRMRIANIGISNDTNGISSDVLNIEVFVR